MEASAPSNASPIEEIIVILKTKTDNMYYNIPIKSKL